MPNSETINTVQSKPLDLGILDFRNEAEVIPTKKCTTPNEAKPTENASTIPVEHTEMTDTTVLKPQLNFFNFIIPNEMDDNSSNTSNHSETDREHREDILVMSNGSNDDSKKIDTMFENIEEQENPLRIRSADDGFARHSSSTNSSPSPSQSPNSVQIVQSSTVKIQTTGNSLYRISHRFE